MVLAAALLVLVGVGLFVLGVMTAVTAWYWACVGACALATALLVAARLRAPAEAGVPAPRADERPAAEPARPPAQRPEPAAAADGEEPAAARPGAGSRARPRPSAAPATTGPQPVAAPAGKRGRGGAGPEADPPEEDEEVTDLLLVVDLDDEVLVVDEHPRYHLADCAWLAGRETVPLPVREARADGFTACARCGPDAHLAHRERARRAARRG
ncbi:hypothetical protein [Geodermatophilus saharensis]|uniref:hypothetical protein n=1 Tax=Geodermatophilus saharensis TaxID=1137994 RepID=UPI001C3CC6A8|nr:hypothetical protein [Geodermatophilus saharensis]